MKRLIHLMIISFLVFGSTYGQPQFENGSFEDWEDVGLGADMMEPVNWSSIKTSDQDALNNIAPVVWWISDDAHTGSHSVYLKNIEAFGIVAAGTITNGRVHADLNPDNGYVFTDINDSKWNSSFTWRPDSVAGWYKCNSAEGDFGTVKVALHTGDLQIPGDETNIVAMAYLELPSAVQSTWKRFSVPFEYYHTGNPEYFLAVLTAGNGVNAIVDGDIWYDDLEFIYNNSSVEENKLENLLVYSSYGKINILVKGDNIEEYQIVVSDLMGRQLYDGKLKSGENLQISNGIPKGVYIVSAINGSSNLSRKIILN